MEFTNFGHHLRMDNNFRRTILIKSVETPQISYNISSRCRLTDGVKLDSGKSWITYMITNGRKMHEVKER
jgi:hypothetical protein